MSNRHVLKMGMALALFALLNHDALADDAESKDVIRVALVQFDAVPGNVKKNLESMSRIAKQARALDARLVMFHELATSDYQDEISTVAESVPDGPSCRQMEKLAKSLNCYIGFGLPERAGKHFHITYAFFGPNGFVERYRKTWLFKTDKDVGFRNEWARYDPGTGPRLFELDGIRATCLICADANSPRCIQRIADLEPELVFFPVNRGAKDFDEYPAIVAKFGASTLVTNRVGYSLNKYCVGGATVYDKSGKILAVANRDGREEILMYDLPVSRQSKGE